MSALLLLGQLKNKVMDGGFLKLKGFKSPLTSLKPLHLKHNAYFQGALSWGYLIALL